METTTQVGITQLQTLAKELAGQIFTDVYGDNIPFWGHDDELDILIAHIEGDELYDSWVVGVIKESLDAISAMDSIMSVNFEEVDVVSPMGLIFLFEDAIARHTLVAWEKNYPLAKKYTNKFKGLYSDLQVLVYGNTLAKNDIFCKVYNWLYDLAKKQNEFESLELGIVQDVSFEI